MTNQHATPNHENDETREPDLHPSTPSSPQTGGYVVAQLAELPEKALVDEKQLALSLKVTTRTIRRMVARFELPPPISLAGRSVWTVGRVLAFFEGRAEAAEREANRRHKHIGQLFP